MAGPGGGPPRRSHTKSRKGCETCKKRHIRCDENFPQCRNCTKHKIRCPYNDMPVPEDRAATPDKPDLKWTPEIEAAIEQWQLTGIFPFPSLRVYPAPSPQFLSREELRLIHHVAAITHQLDAIDANGFTLWTRQIPKIISIGATNRYVLDALLAFSAMHLAFLTECPLVGRMASEHRGRAFTGLREAMGSFSRETSDAILAASLVLSWEATDWRTWTQLMQGTRTVMEAMDPWKHESQFGDFIAESCTFPTAPPSPTPDHKPSQPMEDDIGAFQRTLEQLQKVETLLKHNREDAKAVTQLLVFLKNARKVSPTTHSISQQFDRLRQLRTWLFWLPVLFLQQTGGSPASLLIIAHYYTVALIMERLFPEIGAAYFGSLSVGPVEAIARRMLSINVANGGQASLQTPLTLMEYPIDTVNEFRSRMGWNHPARTQSFPQFDPPNFNFYMPEDVEGTMAAGTAGTAADFDFQPFENPAFSYSTEDLSIITSEAAAGPSSAISPIPLSSPYTQYLNIPSPSHGGYSPSYGGYSPASSNFGELGDFGEASSVVYSDTEETYGGGPSAYDMGSLGGPGASVLGRPDNFGVGFVSPLQTVWSQ